METTLSKRGEGVANVVKYHIFTFFLGPLPNIQPIVIFELAESRAIKDDISFAGLVTGD
jgi:hypothetical protein